MNEIPNSNNQDDRKNKKATLETEEVISSLSSSPISNRLYQTFLRGLMALVPISVTIYVVVWLVGKVEGVFSLFIKAILQDHTYIPGLGLILGISFIYLLGLGLNSIILKKLGGIFLHTVEKVPLFKAIYGPVKELINLFGSSSEHAGKKVVLVDLSPSLPGKIIGLVTRETFEDLGDEAVGAHGLKNYVTVYIPFSYAFGGYTILLEKEKVVEVDIPVEKALKLAITAWLKSPAKPEKIIEKEKE